MPDWLNKFFLSGFAFQSGAVIQGCLFFVEVSQNELYQPHLHIHPENMCQRVNRAG